MLTRRAALAVAASGACVMLRRAGAQSVRSPRLGMIFTGTDASPTVVAFREALARLGHVEGRTFELVQRHSGGRNELLPSFAAEMAAMPVDLIAVVGAVTVRAVRRVSAEIPLVFTVVLDPVADGLVPDAKRPGGNTTGTTNFDPGQPRAQMRLLKQVISNLERVAILGDPGVPDLLDRANRKAAEAEGLRPQNIRLRGASEDMEAAFGAIRDAGADAVLGLEVPAVFLHRARIVELATAARLPVMYPGDWAPFGAPLSYGTSIVEGVRLMAGMVDRIFKGARPGDLPVEVATQHHLTVNLPAARRIGLTIPPEVLARADRVIE